MVWGWLYSRISPQKDHNFKGSSSLNQLHPTTNRTTRARQMTSEGLRCESLEVVEPTNTTLMATTATTDMQFVEHEVQGGDCLYDISRRHNVDLGILLEANSNLNNPDSLIVGSKIKIPQPTTLSQHVPPVRAQQQSQGSSLEGSAYTKATVTVVTEQGTLTLSNILLPVGRVLWTSREHRVVEGDSLEGIAEKYGTTVCALKKLNNLHDDILNIGSIVKIDKQQSHKKHQPLFGDKATVPERNAIFEGALVNIPQPVRAPKTVNPLFSFYPLFQRVEISKSPPRLKTVKVQYGNTLADIGSEHGLSVWELQQYNNLKDDVIIEGDVLAISTGPVNKGLLDLRHGRRRTNRTLFSRQPVSNKYDSHAGGPEIGEKGLPVISGAKIEGKWKHKKKGFQQYSSKWLRFSSPLTDGVLTSPFGWRWGALHEGVDLAAEQGTPILASDKGTVTFCGWSGGYGYLLAIQHEGGFVTRYAHCCAIYTQIGQQVQKGEHVAAVGSTGHATGPHLHFEVRRNGQALDPFEWVNL